MANSNWPPKSISDVDDMIKKVTSFYGRRYTSNPKEHSLETWTFSTPEMRRAYENSISSLYKYLKSQIPPPEPKRTSPHPTPEELRSIESERNYKKAYDEAKSLSADGHEQRIEYLGKDKNGVSQYGLAKLYDAEELNPEWRERRERAEALEDQQTRDRIAKEYSPDANRYINYRMGEDVYKVNALDAAFITRLNKEGGEDAVRTYLDNYRTLGATDAYKLAHDGISGQNGAAGGDAVTTNASAPSDTNAAFAAANESASKEAPNFYNIGQSYNSGTAGNADVQNAFAAAGGRPEANRTSANS